jgi:hypothetical protein
MYASGSKLALARSLRADLEGSSLEYGITQGDQFRAKNLLPDLSELPVDDLAVMPNTRELR